MKKLALITGASSGIGLELAKIHAKNGGDLIIVARRVDKLQELKAELEKEYSVKVQIISSDLSQPGAAKELYKKKKKLHLKVDYLINNAGFGLLGKFYQLSWEKQLEMINLNIIALTELTYLFLPEMIARNSGKILNLSSTASLLPGPLQAIYFATKAFVTSFSNALAEELTDTKVTVTALLPGATATEFAKTSGLENTNLFQKTATASAVANDGYSAMLQGQLNQLSGLRFSQKILLLLIPFLPKKVLLKMVRKMQESK